MFKVIGAALSAESVRDGPCSCRRCVRVQRGTEMDGQKDSDIKVVIGRIEPFGKDKTAIHVSVFGVPCPPKITGCEIATVAHAPFDLDAFADSVRRSKRLMRTRSPTRI